MRRSILYDYSDAYILVSATITVLNYSKLQQTIVCCCSSRKNITIKNCALFTNCISEVNNTQIDHAKGIDIVIPMYNLIEYSGNYSKTLEVYGITTEMNHFQIMVLLMIFLPIIITALRLNLKQKWRAEQEMMVQKMLKLEYH